MHAAAEKKSFAIMQGDVVQLSGLTNLRYFRSELEMEHGKFVTDALRVKGCEDQT